MNLDQFIAQKTGIGIDTDGYYGFQCMDLMHEYCRSVLGLADLRILSAASARAVFENFDNVFGHEMFEKIPNTPTGVPQKGDIMFYKDPWGRYLDNGVVKYAGHVDVFVEGNVNNYRAFCQNWITPNTPKGLPGVVNHSNYEGVLGWLRYKGTSPALSTTGGLPANYADIVKGSSNWDEVIKLGFTNIDDLKKKLTQAVPTYTNQKQQLTELSQKIIEVRDQIPG